jgi:Mn-dependent DtxR family transcriptional regulator
VQVRKQEPFAVAAETKARAQKHGGNGRAQVGSTDGGLTPAKQRLLNGLAFLRGIGATPADKTQLAILVGVSPSSGAYANNLGGLRSAGLIAYPSGGTVDLTDAGAALATTGGVPSTTEELHTAIREKLPPAKWRILEALIPLFPKAISKDDLAARLDVQPTSGAYANNLGSLRSLGLVDYPQPGHVAARPVLFLE